MTLARLMICAFVSIGAFGQTFRGNLSGVVTDSSDAAVVNAGVDLTNPVNGLKRATRSSGNGAFLFAELPVGLYTLTVTLPGFQTKTVGEIEVSVSKTTNLP